MYFEIREGVPKRRTTLSNIYTKGKVELSDRSVRKRQPTVEVCFHAAHFPFFFLKIATRRLSRRCEGQSVSVMCSIRIFAFGNYIYTMYIYIAERTNTKMDNIICDSKY